MSIRIGIIGGSGLYDMAGAHRPRRGRVSDAVRRSVGLPTSWAHCAASAWRSWRGTGRGTGSCPSELNFRANIYGLKMLGVEWILSASAVGSLKQEYRPLDIVIPDQFLDRTRGRISTFFGNGLVAHVGFAHPFCRAAQRDCVRDCRASAGATVHRGGTYVCMEGPQFFDAGRVEALPLVGHGHHRHDQPAGSQARARGRDLLRDDRAGHRLRLLAPGSRPRDGRR